MASAPASNASTPTAAAIPTPAPNSAAPGDPRPPQTFTRDGNIGSLPDGASLATWLKPGMAGYIDVDHTMAEFSHKCWISAKELVYPKPAELHAQLVMRTTDGLEVAGRALNLSDGPFFVLRDGHGMLPLTNCS